MAAPSTDTSRKILIALVVLAVVTGGAALYWLRDILTPLAMAMFLLIMIDGFSQAIQTRLKVSARVARIVSVTLVILGFIGAIAIIVDGAQGFFAQTVGQAGAVVERIDRIIADVFALFGVQAPPTARELVGEIDLRAAATRVALDLQGAATGAFFVLIYLGFLIASQVGFGRKMVGMFPVSEDRREAVEIINRVRCGVQGYLWVQTVTGVMICAVAYALMAVVGLENAGFWTFVIFVVGYIPLLGGVIAGLAPPLFALVQFETYWQAVVLLAGLQALLFFMGNVVQPRMQGDNQNIDPVVVLLALALWGKLWGVIGMFLSTPLAVAAMAVLAQFRGSRWIAVLLSGDGDPYGGVPPRETKENSPQKASRRRVRRKAAPERADS